MKTKTTYTAESATQFGHMSPMNAAMVLSQLKCECLPYQDIFTYNRWQGLGYQVRRGEHGIRIQTFIPAIDSEGNATGKTYPKVTTVFCRCQVDKIGS